MKNLTDFEIFNFTANGETRPVYYQGKGPGVILLHELPGMIPECLDLGRVIAQEGFTVFLPLLFGQPNQPFTIPNTLVAVSKICLSKEFYCFAQNKSSPITNWLKALCSEVKGRCGGKGVGAIGMCLTGGFILSMMTEPSLIAPVASQPSLPFPVSKGHKAALGISPEELAIAKARTEGGISLLALRFSQDKTCPAERFATLKREFGESVETIEIDSSEGNPYDIPRNAHSVLTIHFIDRPDHPTYQARQGVLAFLKKNLSENG